MVFQLGGNDDHDAPLFITSYFPPDVFETSVHWMAALFTFPGS
jgi:hypothetical protein